MFEFDWKKEYKPLTVGDLRKAMEGLKDTDRAVMRFECMEDLFSNVYDEEGNEIKRKVW